MSLCAAAFAAPPPCAPRPRFAGAELGCAIEARTNRPPPVLLPPLDVPSFFEVHNAEVEHAMLIFHPPPGDPFAHARERDRLELWHSREPIGTAFGASAGAFGGAIVAAAHAPGPFRALFDGPLHLGPAVFADGGGMGVGIGFSF